MQRAKVYLASAVGAAMLAGLAGTAAMGSEGKDRSDRGDRRPHHAMKHDGKSWHGHHRFHGGKFTDRRGGMRGGLLGGFAGRHIEGALAFAKAELAITEAQEPQWEALAAAVRDGTERMRGLREEARAERKAKAEAEGTDGERKRERPDLSQRLDRMEAHTEARLETLREVNAAFKPLYASLSDEQKKTVGELMRLRGRH